MIPTFHPAAILHGGGEGSRQFELLREDFLLVRKTLDEMDRAVEAPQPAIRDEAAVDVPDLDQLELF